MKVVLIFVFGVCLSLQAQQKVNKILSKGDKKLAQLDTTGALNLYDKALSIDSASQTHMPKYQMYLFREGITKMPWNF